MPESARPDPRNFFNNMLRRAYDAWQEQPYEEWLAKAAVGYANILAERVALYLRYEGGAHAFRKAIVDECEAFGWVWDVADGVKHFNLDREPRRVSSATQTGFQPLNIDDWDDFDSVMDFDGHGRFVVTGNDGTQRDLQELVYEVMIMWEAKLSELGI